MNASDLVSDIRRRGIELFLEGDRLRFRAPTGAVGPDLRAAVVQHRAAIIEQLSQPSTEKMLVKCIRCNDRDWIDEPPVDGRIRTHCGKCGHFIGYRPVST